MTHASPSDPASRDHEPIGGPRLLRRFARSRSGVAAVEFAFILPIMLLGYFGMTEVTSAYSAQRKLTLLSRTLADLVSRTTNLTDNGRDEIFRAARAIMHPFDGTGVNMTITSVVVIGVPNGPAVTGMVCWSDRSGGGARQRTPGEIVPVPPGFDTPGRAYIMATASSVYTPTIGYAITGSLNLASEIPWAVRETKEVARDGRTCLP
jgi:Flp pilus assembly protein TadG